MSDDSESNITGGLDLNTVSQSLATERATNSIRIRRTRFKQPSRAVATAQPVAELSEDQLSIIANEAKMSITPTTIATFA